MVYTCNPNINYLVPVLELRNIPGNMLPWVPEERLAAFGFESVVLSKLRASGKSPKVAKIVGRYQYDGIPILNKTL